MTQPRWLGAAPALFLLLWSLGFSVSKIGIRYADPMTFLALRYGFVLVLLLPCALWLRPPWPARGIDWLHLAVVGFLIQLVYFGGCYAALALGASAGVVALIVSLQPILVAIVAPAFVGEVVSLTGWAGLALGFAGTVIVILGYNQIAVVSLGGIACSGAALLGMSGATLYEKRFGSTQHPVTANIVQYAVGLIATLPFVLLFEKFHIVWTGAFIASMSYLVIGNSIVAITLLLAMIRHGKASQVSALFYLVPPGAALLAWLLVGERMRPMAWAGMAVAAAGVFLVTRAGRGARPAGTGEHGRTAASRQGEA